MMYVLSKRTPYHGLRRYAGGSVSSASVIDLCSERSVLSQIFCEAQVVVLDSIHHR